jgi:hypothetical protein
MTNTEYIQRKYLRESALSCTLHNQKTLPWVAVFVSCGGLSSGSISIKSKDWSWDSVHSPSPLVGIWRVVFITAKPYYIGQCQERKVCFEGVRSTKSLRVHCKKQIFPVKEFRDQGPNFHIHVSVSDLYSIFPRSICLFCCRKYVLTEPGNI